MLSFANLLCSNCAPRFELPPVSKTAVPKSATRYQSCRCQLHESFRIARQLAKPRVHCFVSWTGDTRSTRCGESRGISGEFRCGVLGGAQSAARPVYGCGPEVVEWRP